MHELGLVYQVVKIIDEVMEEQGLSEISEIVLDVGEMTDVVPKFIEEAWNASRNQTAYPKAEMRINVIEGRAKCLSCGAEESIRTLGMECPHCHSPNLKIISGKEFEINHIVAR